MITIALSKGRILEETLPRLKNAGIELLDDPKTSRKLKFPTTHPDVQVLIIRAADVPTYVEYGAADLGVTGKDVLVEHGEERFYELLDLDIARCKMMIAGHPEVDLNPPYRRLKVATKYVKSTQHYFATQGQQVELIKLYGSMELAPLVGLADCIVDMVDTGNTLRANGLQPLVHIMDISSRLIANKAAFKMKSAAMKALMTCFVL